MNLWRKMGIVIFLSIVCNELLAHHAFVTHFDPSRTFEMQGVVVDFRLRNPHSFITLEAPDENGDTIAWEVELASGIMLRRMGIEANSFKVGDRLSVSAWPNRVPGNNLVYGRTFTNEEGVVYGEHPNLTVTAEADIAASIEGRWSSPLPFRNPQEPLSLNEAGQQALQSYDPKLSPATTCEPATIPDLQLSPYLTDIRISEQVVTFIHEAYGITRSIPLDSSPVSVDSSGYMGIASATIEGDVLVIESSGYPASRWGLSSAAQPKGPPADVPSSPQKKVVERYSVSEDGHVLTLEYSLDDPMYLAEPYAGKLTMSRAAEDQRIYPYECEVDSARRFSE